MLKKLTTVFIFYTICFYTYSKQNIIKPNKICTENVNYLLYFKDHQIVKVSVLSKNNALNHFTDTTTINFKVFGIPNKVKILSTYNLLSTSYIPESSDAKVSGIINKTIKVKYHNNAQNVKIIDDNVVTSLSLKNVVLQRRNY